MKSDNDSACIGSERASEKSARFADVHGDLHLPITVETTRTKCAGSSSSKVADNNIGKGHAQLHNVQFDRSKSAAAQALHKFKFIARTKDGVLMKWDAVEKLFDDLTLTSNGQLPSSKFGQCLGMTKESNEFAGELFTALARRFDIKRTSINKDEMEMFWTQISDKNFDSRLQFFFDMVDKDADGRITKAEVAEIIRISASANQLLAIHAEAESYAAMIMEELDPDNVGDVMISSLETLMMKNVTEEDSESEDMTEQQKPTPWTDHVRIWYQKTKYFAMDNWQRIWVMALWLVILSCVFVYKFLQYRNNAAYKVMGYCVCTAKGAAETLKFNMALILLPVCRNTITWLRNKTKLGVAVPFDDNLNFHMMIAIAVSAGVVLHGGAHLTCDFPRLLHATKEEYEPLKKYFGEKQPDTYWWFLKGVEQVTGIIMVMLMVIAFTLAAPWLRNNKLKLPNLLKKLTGFNAFWYSHHLFVIVYALLIVHGYYLYLSQIWYQKTTWMYLAVPVLLYGSERLIRVFRSSTQSVQIIKAASYPGNVLMLKMTKPKGFKYKSGQYMFIKCRQVSPFEWHPFSITSAPVDDYLTVHIRAVGDWTRQLKKEFSEVCKQPAEADSLQEENSPKYPRISIDGPYGSPAQEYKKYEVVILVGLGSGATPMVSIIKDVINNLQNIERDEEQGGQTPTFSNQKTIRISASPSTPNNTKKKNNNSFKTRRAYFYWSTSKQSTYDWFRGIMNEVAEKDKDGIVELHNYCTSVHKEGDARSAVITMLQTLYHAKNGIDVVSGTRVKCHFARPNWRKVFDNVANHHPDTRVGVFYCGAAAAVKDIKKVALEISHKTSTKFEFHKENF